jgi:acyl carrier protein
VDIYDRVSGVLTTICGVPADRIRPDVALSDLKLDSLALIEVALGLQKEFEVEVDEDRVADASSVAELVTIVRQAVAG